MIQPGDIVTLKFTYGRSRFEFPAEVVLDHGPNVEHRYLLSVHCAEHVNGRLYPDAHGQWCYWASAVEIIDEQWDAA